MSRGLIDAGNWAVSASWAIPDDAVSGVYIAKLVRQDGTAGASHIPFIVRDDSSHQRHRLPDFRHDLAGLQRMGRRQPLFRRGAGRSRAPDRLYAAQLRLRRELDRPRHGRQLQPPDRHQHQRRSAARTTSSSASSIRRSAGSSRTATTSPTSPASIRRARAACSSITMPSCPSGMTNTGRPNSAPMSRRRGTQASTSPSGAATKSTGRSAGKPASTATARRTGRWSATRRPGAERRIRAT